MSGGMRKVRFFWRERRGAVAVSTAFAVSLLIVAFAGLMEIVHTAYATDRMARAARAAARAVALMPDRAVSQSTLETVVCAAIRRELDLDADFGCGTAWTLAIDSSVTPLALLEGGQGGGGDMVAVRIGWERNPWDLGRLLAESSEAEGEAARKFAVGVARHESARQG